MTSHTKCGKLNGESKHTPHEQLPFSHPDLANCQAKVTLALHTRASSLFLMVRPMDTQYTEWLRAVREQGLNDADIRSQLHAAGWTDEHITELLNPGQQPPAPPVPPTPTAPPAPTPQAAYAPTMPSNPTPIATELPGPIAIYRATFASYATRFGYYLGYGAIAGVASIAVTVGLGLLLVFTVMRNLFEFGYYSSGTPNLAVLIGVFMAVYLGLILLNTLIATWFWTAIGLTVMIPDGQRHFFTIFRDAIKRIPQIFWANLIVGYILAGFGILGILATMASSLGLGFLIFNEVTAFLIPLAGLLLFFILISWIGTYLVYTPFVALVGNGRGIHAVRESQSIVHGMWWRTFGRLLAIIAPMLGITIILGIIFILLDVDAFIPNIIIGLLDIAFFLPIFITYTLGMYNTAANYRQQTRPTSKVSTVGMLVVATLGWLIVVGAIILSYVNVREVSNFDDTMFDDSPYPYQLESSGGSTIQNFNTNTSPDLQRTMSLYELQWSLESYKMDKKSYPRALTDLVPGYMEKVPTDPVNGQAFTYSTTTDGQDFNLCITLSTGTAECVQNFDAPSANTNS